MDIHILLQFLAFFQLVTSQNVPNVCFCVAPDTCNTNPGNGNGGNDMIDIRIQTNGNQNVDVGGSPFNLTTPTSSGINYNFVSNPICQNGLQSCCPTRGYECGLRSGTIPGARIPTPFSGQTVYGSYPWIAVIVNTDNYFVGSGALIDHQHVLTVAHKVYVYLPNPQQLVVLMGEWDASTNSEPLPSQPFNVTRIVIHPNANNQNLKNDVAILRLIRNVQLGQFPTIAPACLPSSLIQMSIRCWVAGWGFNNFTSVEYNIYQKEVDIQLLDPNRCQSSLRNTKLGQNFIFDSNSFICGGGESGKDACTGDGGAPLVCSIANRWYVIGLVAWGIQCGQPNIPGVYVNVYNFVGWIQQTVRSLQNGQI